MSSHSTGNDRRHNDNHAHIIFIQIHDVVIKLGAEKARGSVECTEYVTCTEYRLFTLLHASVLLCVCVHHAYMLLYGGCMYFVGIVCA